MFRIRLLSVAALCLVAASTLAAHASTVYSFTLTPTSGPAVGGTALLTLATPIPVSGSFSANEGGSIDATDTNVLALTITMSDGVKFNLSSESGPASFFFYNDILQNFSYNDFNGLPTIGIGGTTYNYTTTYVAAGTSGTVTFNGIVSAVPEPSTLALFGTGMLGIAGAARRRFLKA